MGLLCLSLCGNRDRIRAQEISDIREVSAVVHSPDQRTFPTNEPFLLVLGVAQDAGYPQAGCQKECCRRAWETPELKRFTVSLAIVDPVTKQRWLLDCSPDFREQLHLLGQLEPEEDLIAPTGIFLTHAHIGHYTGLMHLGREIIGASDVSVFAMPRMRAFLESNGPWDQLIALKNITLNELSDGNEVVLNDRIRIQPFLIPHRDEYSEAVGFRISGPQRTVVYLPDIDKWDRWEQSLEDVIRENDVLYLDGTFYGSGELPGRDMSQIPHPFIVETMNRLNSLPAKERNKVRFIHLNHSNPVLDPNTAEFRTVQDAGYNIAEQGEWLNL